MTKKDVLVKVHKTYRWVISMCDADLLNRVLEEGKRQLDLSTGFFDGVVMNLSELKEQVEIGLSEDATFYIVGESAVSFAKDYGLIEEEGILEIEGVPLALVLL